MDSDIVKSLRAEAAKEKAETAAIMLEVADLPERLFELLSEAEEKADKEE